MSIPTTDTIFAQVRCVDFWTEYPFEYRGDVSTKIYYMKCQVNDEDHTPLTIGTGNLTSAATAGVIALPPGFTDATARYVGETAPTSKTGGVVEFVRKFANVPATKSEYEGTVVTLPKAYEDGSNNSEFLGGPTDMPARFEFVYGTDPSGFTINQKFIILFGTLDVNWCRDGVGATVPTKSAFYSSTERVAEPTKVKRWMGDIYYAVTAYIKPEDAY